MYVISAANVNDAFQKGILLLWAGGIREDSRNGVVLRYPTPVSTYYYHPEQRVLLHPAADRNPFFHVQEALWMLAGRNDVASLTPFVKDFGKYSDDGVTSPGAYGRRWRSWFDRYEEAEGTIDQVLWAARRLIEDPADRRVVIQMWDAEVDIQRADDGSADVPCNLIATPYIHDGMLHLTVFCRSNDVVWGAYGANAVHFSFLLEYMAWLIGVPSGTYCQVSNNFHGYLKTLPKEIALDLLYTDGRSSHQDPYRETMTFAPPVEPYPLAASDPWKFPMATSKTPLERAEFIDARVREDLYIYFDEGPAASSTAARWPWLRRVAVPMALAHEHWRKYRGEDRYVGAFEILHQVIAPDWKRAGQEWIQRRYNKFLKKEGKQDETG